MRSLFGLLALFLFTANYQVDGRAVNISNVWILPQEEFPVFYRYFRDSISWYEADAVCQFHHGNLVTVDTTAQYDAVRAYLKELDITTNVWIGLIKNKPEGSLTWSDYRPQSGDGYWQATPNEGQYPICAAADPAADYRWRAFNCGGPEVASFVCELPVPEWALHRDTGCMMHALPALTATYLPGSAAIQLTADCGLAGVKKIMCTGNKSREDLLKDLSCGIPLEEFVEVTTATLAPQQSTPNSTITSNKPAHTQELESKIFHLNITSSNLNISQASTPARREKPMINKKTYLNLTKLKLENATNKMIRKELRKNMFNILRTTDTSQVTATNSNAIITDKYVSYVGRDNEKKQVSVTVAYQKYDFPGNTKIYTQLSDHFIPPLVIAKSKTSTDMAVVSVDEKHSQKAIYKLKNVDKIDDGVITSTATIATAKYNTNKDLHDKTTPSFTYWSKTKQITRSLPSTVVTFENIVNQKPRKDKKYDNKRDNPKYKYFSKYNTVIKLDEDKSNFKLPQLIGHENNRNEEITKSLFITVPSEYFASKENILIAKEATTTNVPQTDSVCGKVTIKPNKNDDDVTKNTDGLVNPNSGTTDDVVSDKVNLIDTTESKMVTATADPIEHDFLNDTMIEPIPKPNRSRILTSSSRHTYYPYFINRVLG